MYCTLVDGVPQGCVLHTSKFHKKSSLKYLKCIEIIFSEQIWVSHHPEALKQEHNRGFKAPVNLTNTSLQSWPFIYTWVRSDRSWRAWASTVFKQSNISLAFSPIIPDLQWRYAPVVDADVTKHCGEMSPAKCPVDGWNWRRAVQLPHKLARRISKMRRFIDTDCEELQIEKNFRRWLCSFYHNKF